MRNYSPITPPPDLTDKWNNLPLSTEEIFVIAARWGADQELDACVKWIEDCGYHPSVPEDLRAARRPKPPSLREQALALLEVEHGLNVEDLDLLRRALEQLND